MPRYSRKYSNLTYIYIIIILVLLFCLFELDHWFGGDPRYAYQYDFYYITAAPLPVLGLYNTFIRATNPSHTHKFNVDEFSSHKIIQERWRDIQSEAMQLYAKKDKLLNMTDIGTMGNFTGIDAEKGQWKVFVLKWYDKPLENALQKCPITSDVISKCPDVHAAMFSILEPGKYIPPHKGPSTACLRYHLGLKIPKDSKNCYIDVNHERFHWKEGEAFIFDDTYIHSVFNDTDEPRIILFIDIERTLQSPLKEINHTICLNASIAEFTKGVNDVSKKVKELYKDYNYPSDNFSNHYKIHF